MIAKALVVLGAATMSVACVDAEPPAETRPIIGRLVTRQHVLTVYATGSGPRLGLTGAAGQVDDIHPDELDRLSPELGRLYRHSIAGRPAVLDARVDPGLARPRVLDKSDVGMHMRSW